MVTSNRKTVFFDTKATGHHGEYLENIISGLSDEDSINSLIVCNPLLVVRLNQFKLYSSSKIKIKPIETHEIRFIESAKNQIQRGIRELKVLEKYLLISGAKYLVFMHMNGHQLALRHWKYSKQNSISISGILFNPLNPTKRKTAKNNIIKRHLMRLRKKLQMFLMLRNKSIKSVFILNDRDAVDYMNSWSFSRNVFRFLIDPIPAGMRSIQVSKEKSESNKQFKFIMMGAISPRKGCLEVIKALKHINLQEVEIVSLRLLGAFSKEYPEYSKLITSEIEALKHVRSNVRVEMQNQFIDNQAFCQEINNSDCVLAPYIKFYGSSGMVGHACRYQKPLLVSYDGLIGEIVRDKKLGLCVDPQNIKALSLALEAIIASNFEYSKSNAIIYYENASHLQFAKNLLD
jgi:glycosyltransferase involved in cell wall biosynthesis